MHKILLTSFSKISAPTLVVSSNQIIISKTKQKNKEENFIKLFEEILN